MSTFILKRKTFAFAKTISNFNNMKNSFKAGNYTQAMKSGMGALGRGAIGVAKVAAPIGLVGGAVAGKQVFDKVTGEDINNSSY